MSQKYDIHNSDIPVLCRSCEARHKGICGVLSPDQLIRLSKQTSKHNLEAGQEVLKGSEPNERYANILKGVVKLTKLTSDGRQQIVGLQFAPDFLGRPFGRQSDVSVEASTDVKVCSFPRRALEAMMLEAPELEHKLHEQALRELDDARDWMLALGRKNAPERVATFFCFLAEHADPELHGGATKSVAFEIPLKRTEIADFLGLTIETVSRQISKLRQQGVIILHDNRQVEVPDLKKLRGLVEQNNVGL
jgi:CRP/FNR family transcriptional regulator, anaerobic regulatory protein